MKKTIQGIFGLLILMLFACNSKSSSSFESREDCINHFLTEFGMSKYDGGTIPCGSSYLVLFENGNTTYAILHNDCADLAPTLLKDCNGNPICTYVTEEGCFEMVQDSERIGIIGVKQ